MHTYTDFVPVRFTTKDFKPFPMESTPLINRINFLNFTESSLFLYLRDTHTDRYYFLETTVELAEDNHLKCRYKQSLLYDQKRIHAIGIIFDYDNKMILVPIQIETIKKGCAHVRMIGNVSARSNRSLKRHPCTDICVEVKNGSFHAQGSLINFSAQGLYVRLYPKTSSDQNLLNQDIPVQAIFQRNGALIFNGICDIVRIDRTSDNTSIVLQNSLSSYNSYSKRTYRNPRQRLAPTPNLFFTHPFLNKHLRFEVFDVSTSGFSVLENAEDQLLIPGMIIHDAYFLFPGELKLNFSAQVLYSQEQSASIKKHGFVFLDMANNTYDELFSILGNAHNQNVHTMTSVDLESLWEFFFSSNFIYQKKYKHIIPHIEYLKKLYLFLYTKGYGLFRSITYERNGKIYGHISMIKAYPGAWLVHHLAAVAMDGKNIGKHLIHQMVNYLEGPFRLPSSDMNFVIFYYRPENTFPEFFFTNTFTAINNVKGCSLDLFDYLSCHISHEPEALPDEWQLFDFSVDDFKKLRVFYENSSGGLLLDALGLERIHQSNESIKKEYSKYDLERNYCVFSLKKSGSLSAVFIVDQSDDGINLSDLLNSVKVLITANDQIEWNIISTVISKLGKEYYDQDDLTVLVYPSSHSCMKNVAREKTYRMFIVNKHYGIPFLENIKLLGKMN